CDKALPGRLDLRLIGRQGVTGVAFQYALQALHGVVGVGKKRAAEQFVVEPRTERSALAGIEGSAKLLIILDIGNQALKVAGCRILPASHSIKLIVDGVAFSKELRPKVRLRLVILVMQNGSAEIRRHLGKPANDVRISVTPCGRIQRRIALNDIDDI